MTFPSLTAPAALVRLARTADSLQGVALTVLPHGGQRAARRNAWSAMAVDATRARSRREAEHALNQAATWAAARAEQVVAAR